jgi:hypothetical protein
VISFMMPIMLAERGGPTRVSGVIPGDGTFLPAESGV